MRRRPRKRAVAFWAIGAVRLLCDGDIYTPVFRWWHPLNWIIAILMAPACAFTHTSILDLMPFRKPAYWRDKPEELVWWSPWSRRIAYLGIEAATRRRSP